MTTATTKTHQPWCVEHPDDGFGSPVTWCQSRTIEVEGYRAFVANAPDPDDDELLTRIYLEDTDTGLSAPAVFAFTRAVEQLTRECWEAVS